MEKHNIQWTSSPWGFRYYNFAAFCDAMRSHGISNVCAMIGAESSFPLALPGELGQLREVISICRDKDIRIVEAAALNDAHAENLKACSLLGSSYYRICGIYENSAAERGRLIRSLQDVGDMAAGYGITVILENHGGLLARSSACRDILLEINRKNVKLNFDAANFAYYGQCPYEAWSELKDLTAFIHLKNLRYDGATPHYCRVRDGIIDYKRLFSSLGAYEGFLCAEYENAEDVEQGTADDLQTLRDIWKQHES